MPILLDHVISNFSYAHHAMHLGRYFVWCMNDVYLFQWKHSRFRQCASNPKSEMIFFFKFKSIFFDKFDKIVALQKKPQQLSDANSFVRVHF